MHDRHHNLTQQVRVMQIIAFAMAMGILTFALVLLLVIRPEANAGDPLLAYVGLLFGGICIPVAWIVPELVARSMPSTAESFQVKLIIGMALLEGAAFLNLIMYMITGSNLSIAMAGLLLFLLLARFPTTNGVQSWIERHEQLQEDNAAFGTPDSERP